MSKNRSSKSGSPQKRVKSRSNELQVLPVVEGQIPKPGFVIATRGNDGSSTVTVNTGGVSGGSMFEADLAQVRLSSSKEVEYVFAMLHGLDRALATHVYRVKVDPELVIAQAKDPAWLQLRQLSNVKGHGRTPADIEAQWGALRYDGSKSWAHRALFTRMTAFSRHATLLFTTIDGGDLCDANMRRGGSHEMPLQPVAEVTMDLATMGELLDTMFATAQDLM